MVVTRKHDGSPRRTVDLSPLNKHCQQETFSSASTFQSARRVPPETWKTVNDAWNGFHSVPLKEFDRHLTTFITPLVAGGTVKLHKASPALVMDTTVDSTRYYQTSRGRNM